MTRLAALAGLALLAACSKSPEAKLTGGEQAMAAKAVADVDAATADAAAGSAGAAPPPAAAPGTNARP